MLRGRSPQGLGGAVYLLVRSFIRVCLFVNIRSSMLSTRGRGILLNTVHPYWIVQVPQIGEQRSSRRIQRATVVFFKISPSENFSPPPSTPTTTTRSCPHAMRRLCVSSRSELRRPGSQPSLRTGAESDFDGQIHYIEQLLNSIKLAEDRVNSNSKLLRLKRSYSLGSIELGLGNRI